MSNIKNSTSTSFDGSDSAQIFRVFQSNERIKKINNHRGRKLF